MPAGSFARSRAITSSYFTLMPTTARPAPTSRMATAMPSITPSTYSRRTSLSLWSRGSHSAAFSSTVSARAASFTWVGKPAPPAPTTPASAMSWTVICVMGYSWGGHRQATRL